MSLFFNPFSKHSGITPSRHSKKELIDGKELKDRTIAENIPFQREQAIKYMGNSVDAYFFAMLEVIIGSHYEGFDLYDDEMCSKGIVDILIFPLVARKLLTEAYQFIDSDQSYQFNDAQDYARNGLAWLLLLPIVAIGACLELARIALAMTLYVSLVSTIAIVATPFAVVYGIGVGLGEIAKAFQCPETTSNEQYEKSW